MNKWLGMTNYKAYHWILALWLNEFSLCCQELGHNLDISAHYELLRTDYFNQYLKNDESPKDAAKRFIESHAKANNQKTA